jgi:uncharacterized protein YaiI (UPF0178 family)
MKPEDFIIYKGFEIPKATDKSTRKVLRTLRKNGVVIFTHDDGMAAITRDELVQIAGAIGLICVEQSHQVLLMTEKMGKRSTIKGHKLKTSKNFLDRHNKKFVEQMK